MSLRRPTTIDLVVDTSAIMAIALDEEPAAAAHGALVASSAPVISAGTLVELTIVAAPRFGTIGAETVRTMLGRAGVISMPVDDRQAELALRAWQRFGRGQHPAALNYGDCFSYALAAHLEVPLLCVGTDFAQTDLDLALR